MSKELVILHFNILEKYPPVMNFILDVIDEKSEYKITVITSVNNSPLANQKFNGVKIWRLGILSPIAIVRYISYIFFNIIGFLILIAKRPSSIIVYESLSIFPLYFYSSMSKNIFIHIHYHEYMSPEEKLEASVYMKLLFRLERKLLGKVSCSQTNLDRKMLFEHDNRDLDLMSTLVLPNMPPQHWWKDFGRVKKKWNGDKIRLVYVGVLDSDSMYLEETLKWVAANLEHLELTIYSQFISKGAMNLISEFVCEGIRIEPALSYYSLPNKLINYDVGLVLYRGYSPNYTYNIPNKVFEYLHCGLKVIADNSLISLQRLGHENVLQTHLQDISAIDIGEIKNWLRSVAVYKVLNENRLVDLM